MKIISTSYILTEGSDAPADITIKECIMCGRKFAVPTVELTDIDEEVCCLDCEDDLINASILEDIIAMRNEDSEENDTINTALGN